MTGHISRSHLHRLDDTTWSYLPSHEGEISENEFEEIRLQIPPIRRGANAYKLIRAITRTFEHNRGMITRDLFKKGFDVKIPIPEKGVTETWNISFHRFSCISNRIFSRTLSTIRNFFPVSRMLKKRATAFCEAHRRGDGLLKRIASCFRRTVTLPNQPPNTLPLPTDGKMVLPTAQNPVERIQAKGFQDSFSRLSTVAFETVEKFFVMERTHRGTFRFIVDADAKLSLEEDEITPKGEVEIARYLDQNRAAVRAYRDFLLSEFGPSFVSQIELSYNIHFNTMIEEGLPLYPDHVSKCNIGANSIELCHVEQVFEGLNKILKLLRQGGDTPSQAQLQAMTQQSALNSSFAVVVRSNFLFAPSADFCVLFLMLEKRPQ